MEDLQGDNLDDLGERMALQSEHIPTTLGVRYGLSKPGFVVMFQKIWGYDLGRAPDILDLVPNVEGVFQGPTVFMGQSEWHHDWDKAVVFQDQESARRAMLLVKSAKRGWCDVVQVTEHGRQGPMLPRPGGLLTVCQRLEGRTTQVDSDRICSLRYADGRGFFGPWGYPAWRLDAYTGPEEWLWGMARKFIPDAMDLLEPCLIRSTKIGLSLITRVFPGIPEW